MGTLRLAPFCLVFSERKKPIEMGVSCARQQNNPLFLESKLSLRVAVKQINQIAAGGQPNGHVAAEDKNVKHAGSGSFFNIPYISILNLHNSKLEVTDVEILLMVQKSCTTWVLKNPGGAGFRVNHQQYQWDWCDPSLNH